MAHMQVDEPIKLSLQEAEVSPQPILCSAYVPRIHLLA